MTLTFVLGHSISYKIACVPSQDSDQPAHLCSLISHHHWLEDTLGHWLTTECHGKTWIRRSIWVFTEHTCNIVENAMLQIISFHGQFNQKMLNLPVQQTKTDAYPNSVDPDEMACNEWSHQDLHCLPFFFCVLWLKPLFASVDMSKFKDGRIHFRNWGMTGLSTPISTFHFFTLYSLPDNYWNMINESTACQLKNLVISFF